MSAAEEDGVGAVPDDVTVEDLEASDADAEEAKGGGGSTGGGTRPVIFGPPQAPVPGSGSG